MTVVAERSGLSLERALARIAARAQQLDRDPRFPGENLLDLGDAGALCLRAEGAESLAAQMSLVRAVARADASTSRIVDGHLNGATRLLLHAPPTVSATELDEIADARLLVGVWGADPLERTDQPATLSLGRGDRWRIAGVKVFCSGAGGVERALVVAGDPDGGRRLAYVDTSQGLTVDRTWFRGSGLRSSESHRVVFHETPVLAILGGPDELVRQPDFARDALRTAATWAGLCDAITEAATAAVAGEADPHQDAAIGRMHVHRQTVELWLREACERLDHHEDDAFDHGAFATSARAAISDASRGILASSALACGSRGLATLPALERSRRDLELFLLQHRLEPQLQRLGAASRARVQ